VRTTDPAPIDRTSADRLAEKGLRLGLVDTADPAAFEAWLQADIRGFHGARFGASEIAGLLRRAAGRRTTGVWDDTEEDALAPVGTVSSWVAPLSVPGALGGHGERGELGGSVGGGTADVEGWAISSVTVAPTHRRRGVARALLAAELRTAQASGVPLAMLTVSEATIYGRYGFAPAARAVDLSIDTTRAGWRGPEPAGRIRFTAPEELHESARGLVEESRRREPGQVGLDDQLWAELMHQTGGHDDEELRPRLRAVRYDDEAGAPRGFALYRTGGSDTEFERNSAEVLYLCATTDDAYAALWHFLIDLDLIRRVTAPLRSVDEPLRWLVADQRAISVTREYDHLWVRPLDVPALLAARRYPGAGSILFEIDDPLGLAAPRVLLEADASGEGRATVVQADAAVPASASVVALGVGELGALWLGGTGARTLARAGRLTERTPGAADAVDALLHAPSAPWLSIWF